MTREEVVEKGYEKAKKVVDRMLDGHGENEQEFVKITRALTLEIDIVDGIEIQIYAVRDGADMDGCTNMFSKYDTEKIYDDIRYLLNCWV